MRTYKVTLLSGQVVTVEADGVEFGPAHVVFWNGDRAELVRAVHASSVVEVTQEPES